MRLTDGKRTIEIRIAVWEGSGWSPDFSDDFFATGGLVEDPELEAYVVEDVEYCVDYAMDWKNGTGDFSDEEVAVDPENRLVDITEIG